MFSRLRAYLSSIRSRSLSLGFTLVELLISTAIITIITAIVLVRYGTFDSVTLLKSLAYEVGLTIREAQVYSVSVSDLSGLGNYRSPYGLNFSVGGSDYTLFRFDSVSSTDRPKYVTPEASDIRTYSLTNGVYVYDVCVWVAGAMDCASDEDVTEQQLDISFRRPEFAALFNAHWLDAGTQNNIERARIELVSPRNTTNIWIVDVNLLGQISINKKD